MGPESMGSLLIFSVLTFALAVGVVAAVFFMGVKFGQSMATPQYIKPQERNPGSTTQERRQIMREQLGLNVPLYPPVGFQPVGAKLRRQQEVGMNGGNEESD